MSEIRLRIASYNIRKARGLDQRRRPERTLQVINALDADIVLLQEADKRLGARRPAIPRALIEAETDFHLVDVNHNGISLGFHGNAVLVRRGLMVSNITPLTLPGTEPRGAVCFDTGPGLSVVATHLGLRRRDRQHQLALLARYCAHRSRVVIGGDFNEWSATQGLDPLLPRFRIVTPGRSFHARRPMAALDRFALTEGVSLQEGGVQQDALARRASDHLPVWADLTLPSPASTY